MSEQNNQKRRRRRRFIWSGILILLLLIGAAYWAMTQGLLPNFIAGDGPNEFGGFPPDQGIMVDGAMMVDGEMMPDGMMPMQETVPIQPATDFIPDVVASGRLALREIEEMTAPVDSTIISLTVELGDLVAAGDKLVAMDVDAVAANLDQQLLDLNKARKALADLFEEKSEADLLAGNAELLDAQEALTKLRNGPDQTEINDATLKIREAQAALTELEQKNDPNSQEVREARFSLSEARNSLQRAQQSYDAISWKGDLAASLEAEQLKNATIGLERAQVAFDKASAPADANDLDAAKLAIARAQADYDKLLVPPSQAEFEKARARISKAEQDLETLREGPTDLQVQEAETAVMNALKELDETREQLTKIDQLTAPISGRIVNLPVKADQSVQKGDVIVAIAADKQFEIEVEINELSILNIEEGMDVEVTSDVVPDETLFGTVARIAPTEVSSSNSSAGSGSGGTLASFPVVVDLLDAPLLQKLRAGMSAEVQFIGSNQLPANSWLVPLNAVEDVAGDSGTIKLLRGEETVPLEVTVIDQTQGEWQVVVSEELEQGDLVFGSTTSFLNDGPSDIFFGP